MSTRLRPSWPLPLIAVAQTQVGSLAGLEAWSVVGPPSLIGAAVVLVVLLAALVLFVLAVRNLVRIWALEPRQASWGLAGAALLGAGWCAISILSPVGSGPVAQEVALALWSAPAVVLVAAAARDLARLAARRRSPG